MVAGTRLTGEPSGPSYGIKAYTGREWDPEIGLYYYRARYYEPRVGRFISEDPIGLMGGPNVYEYVMNRPLQLVDPSGAVPPRYPKPNEDRFCYDQYQGCVAAAAAKAGVFLAACLVTCALAPVPALGKGACVMACLYGSVVIYSIQVRACEDMYEECIKRYPPERKKACRSSSERSA
jgi:RHS repeat-associated protein